VRKLEFDLRILLIEPWRWKKAFGTWILFVDIVNRNWIVLIVITEVMGAGLDAISSRSCQKRDYTFLANTIDLYNSPLRLQNLRTGLMFPRHIAI
jgi:hypothetical protein